MVTIAGGILLALLALAGLGLALLVGAHVLLAIGRVEDWVRERLRRFRYRNYRPDWLQSPK